MIRFTFGISREGAISRQDGYLIFWETNVQIKTLINVTSSNQRLGSAFYRICSVIMETDCIFCEEKQIQNYGYAFLAGWED